MDDKPLDPAWRNFAWKNGKLCAFRQKQPDFLKINTLDAIKVLLVTLDIESRVDNLWYTDLLYMMYWKKVEKRRFFIENYTLSSHSY